MTGPASNQVRFYRFDTYDDEDSSDGEEEHSFGDQFKAKIIKKSHINQKDGASDLFCFERPALEILQQDNGLETKEAESNLNSTRTNSPVIVTPSPRVSLKQEFSTPRFPPTNKGYLGAYGLANDTEKVRILKIWSQFTRILFYSMYPLKFY